MFLSYSNLFMSPEFNENLPKINVFPQKIQGYLIDTSVSRPIQRWNSGIHHSPMAFLRQLMRQ